MIRRPSDRVEKAPKREQQLQQRSRDYRAGRKMYDAALKRYHDAEAAAEVEGPRGGAEFQIVEPAIPAREPTAPNRVELILLGVVLAIAATGAAVLLTRTGS
jgi:polysaccharide biosynthesis transport protein